MDKTCTICKQTKLFSEYNKKKTGKNGLQPHCRDCSHRQFKKYYNSNLEKHRAVVTKKNKETIQKIISWLDEIKSVGCSLCDETEICVMDFHHIDPETKVTEVAQLVKNCSFKRLVNEINKCVLICANCHRKVHKGLLKVDKSMMCCVTAPS